eukprot:2775600-Amphidinium_carterae.1
MSVAELDDFEQHGLTGAGSTSLSEPSVALQPQWIREVPGSHKALGRSGLSLPEMSCGTKSHADSRTKPLGTCGGGR